MPDDPNTTDTAQPPAEECTIRRFLCLGRRLAHDDSPDDPTLYIAFQEVDADNQPFGAARYFDLKKFRICYAGNIYTFKATEKTVWANTMRYWGHTNDEELRKQCQTLTQNDEAIAESRRRNKKDGERDLLLETLTPYRKIYSGLIGSARKTALDMAVLRALHTPLSK